MVREGLDMMKRDKQAVLDNIPHSRAPKILYLDIETSLMTLGSFTLKTEYTPYSNIIEDFYIICAAWQFLGEKAIHSARVEKIGEDLAVVKQLRDAIESADVIVYHNGDKFDLKKLNTRIIKHRLTPLPHKIVSVDTLKEARRIFSFSSNRLDYLGIFLGVGHKTHVDGSLWLKVLKGDLKAVKNMERYCKGDIKLGVAVYDVMKPYIRLPSIGSIISTAFKLCNACHSSKLTKRGYMLTLCGRKQRYQCQNCGKWDFARSVEK